MTNNKYQANHNFKAPETRKYPFGVYQFELWKLPGFCYLVLGICFIFSGCTTEFNLATRQQETTMYGTEREVKIGDAVARRIEDHYDLVSDRDANERVERILESIVAVSDRQDIVYFIKIIDEDIKNAVSLPGGYIYIFKGLLDEVKSDDQLAGVIAHEVGHITARHGIKRLQAQYGYLFLQAAAIATEPKIAAGVSLALSSIFMEYSQQDEFEADKLAVKYLKKAGYNPNGITEFFEILREEQQTAPTRTFSYWKTHPNLAKRIAVVNQAIKGEMDFRDYIMMMGN